LSSVGVGVRVTFLEALTARLELGKPLSRTPYDADDRSWRQFFQFAISH
jgi:hemolysin activation/secretion protein